MSLDVLAGEGRAAISYQLETPAGTVDACDWIFVENGRIREVNAYYDSVTNRAAHCKRYFQAGPR